MRRDELFQRLRVQRKYLPPKEQRQGKIPIIFIIPEMVWKLPTAVRAKNIGSIIPFVTIVEEQLLLQWTVPYGVESVFVRGLTVYGRRKAIGHMDSVSHYLHVIAQLHD
jgi:hypothetical protein